jgi:c-di-GMP-binding flagellar brake protein YcgR
VPRAYRQTLDAWLKENAQHHEPITAPPPVTETVESIPLAAPDQAPASESERRVQSRVPCRIGAEIYPLGSKVPHRCSLIDISPGGCYVETTTPLPAGTSIDIVVRTNRLRVNLKGSVRSAHRGYGMGIEFTLKTAEQQRQLKQLIAWQAEAVAAAVENQ